MLRPSEKIFRFNRSLIRKISRMAYEYGAINLSQGFPDFEPPKKILDRLEEIAHTGPHQYPISIGAKNFRDALAKKQSRLLNKNLDPEREIIVTCGCTEAMIASMMAMLNSGDKIIIFSPFYENYRADSALVGLEPIYINLYPPEYKFDFYELENAFKQGAKALILCNPLNPLGKVFKLDELEIIASLIKKYNGLVITDEVYEHIVYKPNEHIYFASLPGMFERTISCSSLSKTYSITGWRIGYAIAPEHIASAIGQVHDFLTVASPAPLQESAALGLSFEKIYYQELLNTYSHKREIFLKGLDDLGLTHTIPDGSYFVLIDISEFGYENDILFCEDLIKKLGIAFVPGSNFFHEDIKYFIRGHFAKRDETLYEALNKLEKIKKVMKK